MITHETPLQAAIREQETILILLDHFKKDNKIDGIEFDTTQFKYLAQIRLKELRSIISKS